MNSNNMELRRMVEDNHVMIQEMYNMMTGMRKPESKPERTEMNTMPQKTKMVSVPVEEDEEGFRNKKIEGFAGSRLINNNKLRTIIKVVLILLVMLLLNNKDTKKQINSLNNSMKLPKNSLLFVVLVIVILLVLFLL